MRAIALAAVLILFPLSTPAFAIVNMKNANYADTWVDLLSKGSDNSGDIHGLGVRRTYNSRSLYDGIFGFGWCSDFETKLMITAEANVILKECGGGWEVPLLRKDYDPKEREQMAQRIVNGLRAAQEADRRSLGSLIGGFYHSAWEKFKDHLIKEPALRAQLASRLGLIRPVQNGTRFFKHAAEVESLIFENGGFRREPGDGSLERFDREGRLIEKRDRSGRKVTLLYREGRLHSVEDGQGRRLEFEFHPSGKVRKIAGPDGLGAEYWHSPEGNLIKEKNAWNNVYTFEYDDGHNLTKIEFPDKTFKRIAYDKERDWVVSFRNRDGCIEDYSYAILDGLEHYLARVVKTCQQRVEVEVTYEFIHALRPTGEKYLRRVITDDGSEIVDITYHEIFENKRLRQVVDGRVTEFEYYPDGRLKNERHSDFHTATKSKTKDSGPPLDPMHAAFMKQRSNGDFTGAAATLDEWDNALKKRGDDKARIAVAGLAFILGFDRAQEEQYHLALGLFSRMLTIAVDLGLEDKYLALEWIGRIHLEQRHFSEAERVMLEAIALIEKKHGSRSPKLVAFLDLLAQTYRRMGRYVLAFEALQRSASVDGDSTATSVNTMTNIHVQRKADFMRNPSAVSEDILADIYEDVGLYQSALEVYRSSLRAVKAAIDAEQVDHNEYIIDNIASVFRTLGQYDSALTIQERHISALEKKFGPDSPRVARQLSQQGVDLTFLGQYETALPVLARSVALLEKPKSGNESSLAGALNHLGILYSRLGQHEKAVELYQRSLKLDRGVDSNHPHLRPTMLNLAASYRELGHYQEAAALLNRTLVIGRASYPAGHKSIGDDLFQLGETYRLSGDKQRALFRAHRSREDSRKRSRLESLAGGEGANSRRQCLFRAGQCWRRSESLPTRA